MNRKEINKKYYEKNKERLRELNKKKYSKEFYEENKEYFLKRQYKNYYKKVNADQIFKKEFIRLKKISIKIFR